MEQLIETYGYLAILIGTFLEGETILVLGGIAASFGYLELSWVIISAFSGTLAGDQLFFFLGRYKGQTMLDKRPTWKKRAETVHRIMESHHIPIILGFRFLYGLRNIIPFVIGMSRVPTSRFFVLNVLGAAIWSVIIGLLGYVLGERLADLLGDIKRYEIRIFATTLAIGASIWILHSLLSRCDKHDR